MTLEHDTADDETLEPSVEGGTGLLMERMFKLRKKIDEDMVAELEAMDGAQLRNRISQCEHDILESEIAKAGDFELARMKEQVKIANAPYAEVKKLQRALAEYAACLLDLKGIA